MGTMVNVMLNALEAMGKIFVVCIIGIIAAKYPKGDSLLPVNALRYLSRLSNLVLLPCLIIFSLGSSLSLNLLNRIGILAFFSVLNSCISLLLAMTVGKYMHEPNNAPLFTAVYVSIGFPNAISLPIMVMQTLCENPLFSSDYDNDSTKCYAETSSMLFVYSMGWHLLFWSYAFPTLQGIADVSTTTTTTGDQKNSNSNANITLLLQWSYKVLLTPSMIACVVGILIGIIQPIQSVFFASASGLHFIGASIETLGTPVVCLSCLIMSASLAHSDFSAIEKGWSDFIDTFLFDNKHYERSSSGGDDTSCNIILATQTTVGISTINTSDLNQSTNPTNNVSTDIESNDTTHSPITSTHTVHDSPGRRRHKSIESVQSELDEILYTVLDGKTLCTEDDTAETGNERAETGSLPEWRTIGAVILCRLILAPLAMLCILHLCIAMHILHTADKMLLVVILIEAAAPSAQTIIVCLNQIGVRHVASALAFIYVCMYIVSILTVTLWTTVAIQSFY